MLVKRVRLKKILYKPIFSQREKSPCPANEQRISAALTLCFTGTFYLAADIQSVFIHTMRIDSAKEHLDDKFQHQILYAT